MKIIVLGAGQVGSTVAINLASEENDVTVVDDDESMLKPLEDQVEVRTIVGKGSHPDILRRAGAEDADMLIAATNSDEVNIVACQIAYTLFRTPAKIARMRAQEYMREQQLFNSDNIPIDVLISPERLVTDHIRRIIEHPGALQVVDFAGGIVRLVGVEVSPGAPMDGSRIGHLGELLGGKGETRVVAIYRGDTVVIPRGDTLVMQGDIVFFLSLRKQTAIVMAQFHTEVAPCRRVMIAGGGNIGQLLATRLERHYRVKIIEADETRAEHLSSVLSTAMVLYGDAANHDMLVQENIEDMDVFCALTNDDEANILSAMLAKRMGARKIMSLINRSAYVDLVERGIIDVAISPQQITIGALLTHIRRGDVVAVHSLRKGMAEALEGVAHGDRETSRLVGRTIGELPLPTSASLGALVRGRKVLIAHHDVEIEPEDHLIVLVTDKRQIPAVEQLFQVGVTFV